MIPRRSLLAAIPALPLLAVPAVAAPKLTPHERILAATAEIKTAMRELYPGWAIDEKVNISHRQRFGEDGALVDVGQDAHVVLLTALAPKPWDEEIRWYRHT